LFIDGIPRRAGGPKKGVTIAHIWRAWRQFHHIGQCCSTSPTRRRLTIFAASQHIFTKNGAGGAPISIPPSITALAAPQQ
jgi:hypothetical protein